MNLSFKNGPRISKEKVLMCLQMFEISKLNILK